MDQGTGSGAETADDTPAQPASLQTGDPRVDQALLPLAGLAGRPVAEHPQVFERLHGQLVDVLGELGSSGRGG